MHYFKNLYIPGDNSTPLKYSSTAPIVDIIVHLYPLNWR